MHPCSDCGQHTTYVSFALYCKVTTPTWTVSPLVGSLSLINTHYHHSVLSLGLKADNLTVDARFSILRTVEGRVHLGTALSVCSLCPRMFCHGGFRDKHPNCPQWDSIWRSHTALSQACNWYGWGGTTTTRRTRRTTVQYYRQGSWDPIPGC